MPTLTPAQWSNLWPITAWCYAAWRARSLGLLTGQPFSLAREARLFTGRCAPQPGEHWLDAGASAGFYAGVLARQGCRVTAADLSPAMLREGQRREPSPQIDWVQVNLESAAWPGEQFDGVTIGATLNETAQPARLLGQCARWLRPGGQLWLMYVADSGGAGQRVLSRLGGLTFPAPRWVSAKLPGLHLTDQLRVRDVVFARYVKTAA